MCSRVLPPAPVKTYYCSEECAKPGEEFYGGFKTIADTVTVFIQIERVGEQVLEMIPRQTNEQLLALYTEILGEQK